MFKVLEGATAPTKGSKYSACIDLYASETVIIGAGETKLVGLGVAIDLSKFDNLSEYHKENFAYAISDNGGEPIEAFKNSHYLQLMLRSSLGKKGLVIPNGVGVIDLDYEDEIKVLIHNAISFTSADSEIDFHSHCKSGADDKVEYRINKGDRIAQITLLEHKGYLLGVETETERAGGFGSTGS